MTYPCPKTMWRSTLLAVALTVSGAAIGPAQAADTSATVAGTPSAVVDAAIAQMRRHYVFPEKVPAVEARLRKDLQAGAFKAEGEALAEQLTRALQDVTKDRHIRLYHSPDALPEDSGSEPSAEALAAQHHDERLHNYGVEKVERLPFNIGLIQLSGFGSMPAATGSFAAAMNLVAHTDALIVDLRQNHGGDPETVAFMLSYLFDKRTHLNDMFMRATGRTEQYWTHQAVPGQRWGQQKPLYVLTSAETFSGGEEFAYDVKALKRGTLIGETTGGGAHPGDVYRLTAHFEMFVPNGRAINPITRTNWEGTGVAPDVQVPQADALAAAQAAVLREMMKTERDAKRRASMQKRLGDLGR